MTKVIHYNKCSVCVVSNKDINTVDVPKMYRHDLNVDARVFIRIFVHFDRAAIFVADCTKISNSNCVYPITTNIEHVSIPCVVIIILYIRRKRYGIRLIPQMTTNTARSRMVLCVFPILCYIRLFRPGKTSSDLVANTIWIVEATKHCRTASLTTLLIRSCPCEHA